MKTKFLTNTISNSHPQAAITSAKAKCAIAMALVLLSSVHLVASAGITSTTTPQRQPTQRGPGSIIHKKNPIPIPSLDAYQVCLSKAMDILKSGVCNGASDIRFCIKAKFVANGDNCALYL